MLNFITPELIVKAAGLVKQGKVYPLGEEMHSDLPRAITPSRFGVQVITENDGYDRVTQPGQFDPKRNQGAASYTVMHNHVGTHLDTFAHIYRENSLFNNMPPPKPVGTVHGDAASVKFMVGRGVLLDVAKYKGQDPLPANYWITLDDLQNTAKAQNVEIRKGDILLIRTGWRKMWDQPGPDGRVDLAHAKYLQPEPGVGPDSLQFLNDMEIVAIGADTAAVEWNFPLRRPATRASAFGGFQGLPLHVDFIWNRGAYIIEIMNLDELAKDQAYEFLFVVAPAPAAGRHRRAGQPDRHPVGRGAAGAAGRRAAAVTERGDRPCPARRDARSFPLGDGGALEVLDVEHLALPPGSCTVAARAQRLGQDDAAQPDRRRLEADGGRRSSSTAPRSSPCRRRSATASGRRTSATSSRRSICCPPSARWRTSCSP